MTRTRTSQAALVVIASAFLAITACNEAPRNPHVSSLVPWSQPTSPPLRLIDLDGKISGEALAPDAGVLARWSAAELSADWSVDSTEKSRVFTLPRIPVEAGAVRSVRITMRPGGAEKVVIEPSVNRPETENLELVLEKAFRAGVLPIPVDVDPDRTLTFSYPLREAAKGNWFDAAAPARLTGLSIAVSGHRTIDTVIEEIVFVGDRVALSGPPATQTSVEIGGIVRPAWMVATGSKVEFEVDVPERDPVLRWHDGAIGGAGPRTVSIEAGASAKEIHRTHSSGPWEANEIPLDPWAGTQITIELSTLPPSASGKRIEKQAARGVGVFGTPEISSSSASAPPPDILIYLIDALRADRLGAWGHSAARTPQLDRLAKEGSTFKNAISSSCWTKPAVVTLLTGIQPTTHGVGASSSLDLLSDRVPVLQQRFRTAGWRTGSFTANPLASNLSKLDRGFDVAFLPRSWAGRIGPFLHPTAAQLHESMLAWIDEAPGRPFFAYVHTLEVHQNAMPNNVGDGTENMPAYERAVARADTLLGDLLDELRDRRRLDNLLIVVVSDHGESLGEHGILGHGQSLYQTEIHVPLIFWAPSRIPAGSYDAPVALADIGPTLLELSGMTPFEGVQGKSLVPVLRGEASSLHEIVFSSHQGLAIFPDTPRQYSLVTADGGKLLRVDGLADYVFELGRDPGERAPSLDSSGAFRAELDAWLAEQRLSREHFELEHPRFAHDSVIDLAEIERLRALGYRP